MQPSIDSPGEEARSLGTPLRTKRPAVAYLLYGISRVTLGGSELVSVPLLSRIFSRSEYGNYLLVFGLLVFLSDAASLWASTTFVRQAASLSDAQLRARLRATLLTALLLGSGIIALALAAAAGVAAATGAPSLAATLGAAAIYLPLLSTLTFILADLQAAGRVKLYCGVAIARVSTMIGGGLLAVAVFGPSATAFLAGSALGLTMVILPYWAKSLTRHPFGPGSAQEIRAALSFGVGMWFQNVGAKVLRIGDRYVIGLVLGSAAVATYGAGYTLLYGSILILVTPFLTLITPIAFTASDTKGYMAAKDLIDKSLVVYFFSIALVVSFMFVAYPGVMYVMLPREYASAFSAEMVLALLLAGAGHGATQVVGLVFAIKRRTMISAALFLVLAVTNLAGNAVFVPAFGIAGAVWVTFLSYFTLFGSTVAVARRHLPIRIPSALGMLCIGGPLIAYLISRVFADSTDWLIALMQLFAVTAWYAAVLAFCPDLRGHLMPHIAQRFSWHARPRTHAGSTLGE